MKIYIKKNYKYRLFFILIFSVINNNYVLTSMSSMGVDEINISNICLDIINRLREIQKEVDRLQSENNQEDLSKILSNNNILDGTVGIRFLFRKVINNKNIPPSYIINNFKENKIINESNHFINDRFNQFLEDMIKIMTELNQKQYYSGLKDNPYTYLKYIQTLLNQDIIKKPDNINNIIKEPNNIKDFSTSKKTEMTHTIILILLLFVVVVGFASIIIVLLCKSENNTEKKEIIHNL